MKNSMKITLRICHDGTERTLVAGPGAIVAFERKWGIGIPTTRSEVRVEHLAWLAHQAAWREAKDGGGAGVKPFDDWLADLEDIEALADAEDDAGPLGGTA